jgi:putative ABC transport system permease protein
MSERIRAVAAGLEPQVAVTERPLLDYVRGSLGPAALAGRVAWAIGALALWLAVAGAFGVFAQAAEARRHEIGLRVALGATPQQIAAIVLATASQILLGGVLAGFVLSALGVPVLRRFLYGLNPFDPVAYAGVAGIMAVAVALATWIPVRRAISVDPAVTLRSE